MKPEHLEELKEIMSLVDSVLNFKRDRYVYELTSSAGTVTCIENREQFLTSMMEVIQEDLCLLIEEIEEPDAPTSGTEK